MFAVVQKYSSLLIDLLFCKLEITTGVCMSVGIYIQLLYHAKPNLCLALLFRKIDTGDKTSAAFLSKNFSLHDGVVFKVMSQAFG